LYPSNTRIIRHLILFFIGAAVCIGTLYFGFLLLVANALASFGGNSCPPETPSLVEEMAGFKLPPSASNLSSQCWGMQGALAYASFEIARSDLDYLLQHVLVETPLSTTTESYSMTHVQCCLAQFLYGEHREGEVFQQLLIDTSNPEIYTVYVETLLG
jgi:hypothetical protein